MLVEECDVNRWERELDHGLVGRLGGWKGIKMKVEEWALERVLLLERV
jgi:hypothetical protein